MQTQVLPEGTTEWKTLGDLPEFATAVPGIPPAMPSIPAPSTARAELVSGPAIGLDDRHSGRLPRIASLVMNLAGASFLASSRFPRGTMADLFSGTVAMIGIIGILLSGLILGGLKMKNLESYGLAMTVSIIAMIPCFSPCCLLDLPIGIWAPVVLSKPEVEERVPLSPAAMCIEFIGGDQKEYGPVSADELRHWIAEGRLSAQSYVQVEGGSEWKPLSSFPEFAKRCGPGRPILLGRWRPARQLGRLERGDPWLASRRCKSGGVFRSPGSC